MRLRSPRYSFGFTLIEVIVAMAILAIASVGALGYQYYAARQARIAKIKMVSTHIANMLLQDWKSTGGTEQYAEEGPADLGLGFSEPSDDPAFDSEGIPGDMAEYNITVEDIPMLVVLAWGDVEYDEVTNVTIRQLAVRVFGGVGTTQSGRIVAEQLTSEQAVDIIERPEPVEPVTLTTYVRLDGSGG